MRVWESRSEVVSRLSVGPEVSVDRKGSREWARGCRGGGHQKAVLDQGHSSPFS